MYVMTTLLIMFALPIVWIAAELYLRGSTESLAALAGRWFVFWGVGVRLLSAGLFQIFRPKFTTQRILQGGEANDGTVQVVQELGFANVSLGLLGVGSYFAAAWILPAAVAGGVFFALAGLRHAAAKQRNRLENVALVSDLAMAAILLWSLVAQR